MGRGDTLASGGVKATWGPLNVTKEKWDEIFNSIPSPKTFEDYGKTYTVKVFSDGTFTVKEDKKKRGGKGNGTKRHNPKKARV